MDQFDIELAEAAQQRTQVWRDARAGKFTASEIYKIMTEPRNKKDREAGLWSEGAMTYILTKVAEEITGQVHETSAAYPLVWGEDMEPQGKEYFTRVTGKAIMHAGFKVFNPHAGGSPDGFVEDGLIEIKCPYNSTNQVNYLRLQSGLEIAIAYPEYWWQMQANMIFNKRDKTYFVAYDPRFPDKYKMKILEVFANPEDQNTLLEKLGKAIEEKLRIIQQLA